MLNQIIPRFTALQVYQAILESQASEHAATDDLHAECHRQCHGIEWCTCNLEYNKARQQSITNEMLDIAGGAEALSKSLN